MSPSSLFCSHCCCFLLYFEVAHLVFPVSLLTSGLFPNYLSVHCFLFLPPLCYPCLLTFPGPFPAFVFVFVVSLVFFFFLIFYYALCCSYLGLRVFFFFFYLFTSLAYRISIFCFRFSLKLTSSCLLLPACPFMSVCRFSFDFQTKTGDVFLYCESIKSLNK